MELKIKKNAMNVCIALQLEIALLRTHPLTENSRDVCACVHIIITKANGKYQKLRDVFWI